jgi:hypothetical protein
MRIPEEEEEEMDEEMVCCMKHWIFYQKLKKQFWKENRNQ